MLNTFNLRSGAFMFVGAICGVAAMWDDETTQILPLMDEANQNIELKQSDKNFKEKQEIVDRESKTLFIFVEHIMPWFLTQIP